MTEPNKTLRLGPRLLVCLPSREREKQLLGTVTKGLMMVVLIFLTERASSNKHSVIAFWCELAAQIETLPGEEPRDSARL